MTIEHDGVVALGLGGRHFEEDHGRATGQADYFELQTRDLLAFDPGGRIAQHFLDMAVGGPIGIEHRAFGRDGDVLGQGGNDFFIPDLGGELAQGGGFFALQRQRGVTSIHVRLLCGEAVSLVLVQASELVL